MPCSFTPLTRKIVSGVLVLRTWLRKVSCRFCARSAAIVIIPHFLIEPAARLDGLFPAAKPPLRSPSEGPAGAIRRQARFLGKRVPGVAPVKTGKILQNDRRKMKFPYIWGAAVGLVIV